MPKVSVLIPVYKAEKTISYTLESVKSQTFTDYEVVLVDDGTPDNSIGVAKEIVPDAIIIRQENGGITKALNTGIAHCSGEYIARIDCDDSMFPNRLSDQVAFMDSHPDYGVIGGHFLLNERDGRILGTYRFPVDSDDALRNLLSGKSIIQHEGALIRKSVLIEAGGYDEFYNGREDFELWTRISLLSKIGNLDKVIGTTRSVAEGISFSAIPKAPLVQCALDERIEREKNGVYWKNENIRRKYSLEVIANESRLLKEFDKKQLKARFLCKRAGIFQNSGDYLAAAREYMKALNADPSYYRSYIGIATFWIPSEIYKIIVNTLKKITGKYTGYN